MSGHWCWVLAGDRTNKLTNFTIFVRYTPASLRLRGFLSYSSMQIGRLCLITCILFLPEVDEKWNVHLRRSPIYILFILNIIIDHSICLHRRSKSSHDYHEESYVSVRMFKCIWLCLVCVFDRWFCRRSQYSMIQCRNWICGYPFNHIAGLSNNDWYPHYA